MELDRCSEFVARLSCTILFEVKEGLQLEAVLAGLYERANHVRIALDLADISNSFLCDVLIRWLRKERHRG